MFAAGIGKSETNFIVKEPTAGQDGIVAAYRSLSAKDRKTVAEFVDFLICKSAKTAPDSEKQHRRNKYQNGIHVFVAVKQKQNAYRNNKQIVKLQTSENLCRL